jgi:hypothetical protein
MVQDLPHLDEDAYGRLFFQGRPVCNQLLVQAFVMPSGPIPRLQVKPDELRLPRRKEDFMHNSES